MIDWVIAVPLGIGALLALVVLCCGFVAAVDWIATRLAIAVPDVLFALVCVCMLAVVIAAAVMMAHDDLLPWIREVA